MGEAAADDDDEEEEEEEIGDVGNWGRGVNDERTWEFLREDSGGRLLGPDILARQREERKRKYSGLVTASAQQERLEQQRLRQNGEPAGESALPAGSSFLNIRRGVIRYLYLCIDMSQHSVATDLRPSRLALISAISRQFIREFFDQNPLSHLGLLMMRDKLVEQLTDLSGSPEMHIAALAAAVGGRNPCKGEASLQNCLESALPGLVQGSPPYGCKELLILSSSLTTVDAGDIFKAINECEKKNVRVSVVGVAAEVHVCRQIAAQTGGTYSVATSEAHLEQLMLGHAQPPPKKKQKKTGEGGGAVAQEDQGSRLVRMGFPDRASDRSIAYFEAEGKIGVGGYTCPQCGTRVSDLPAECATCRLMLISAPHLARSYHHLFPVPVFRERTLPGKEVEGCAMDDSDAPGNSGENCIGCSSLIVGVRLECPRCMQLFCFDCDSYIHDKMFVCPGCESV